MSFFDRLRDGLDFQELASLASELQSGKLDIKTILTPAFMQKYTDFQNVEGLLNKLDIQNIAQITDYLKDKTNRQKADEVVNEHSQFSSLQEMIMKAMKK